MKGRPARDVTAAVVGADPTPAVDPERFQDETQSYPGHWREDPAPWPYFDSSDPVVRAAVVSGLAALPETWARAVRGQDVERRPGAQVAAELGVTPARLRDLVNRARAELREHLARALGRGEDRP
jgi:RNA polymerase sigma-70 factor (ECF subfamily)